MIIEKTIGKLKKTDKTIDKVYIDWFERDKKLLRKISSLGTEVGIRVSEPLNDGDILYEDESTVMVVEMSETDLIKVSVKDMCEMGRLCFEIGNRHLSLSIESDSMRVPYDEPTFEYLKKLGFKAERVKEKFTDYIVCSGHSHTHSHEHNG